MGFLFSPLSSSQLGIAAMATGEDPEHGRDEGVASVGGYKGRIDCEKGAVCSRGVLPDATRCAAGVLPWTTVARHSSDACTS